MNHPSIIELQTYGAIISPCRRYRYALHRNLSFARKACLFIMLNPSTANESTNDNTIRRCIGFAKSWDCGDLYVANLFAWRSTDPKELRKNGVGDGDIVGPENKNWIESLADYVVRGRDGMIVCAWGPPGRYLNQDQTVIGWLEDDYELMCLGKSKDGSPRHPLMLRKDRPLINLLEEPIRRAA